MTCNECIQKVIYIRRSLIYLYYVGLVHCFGLPTMRWKEVEPGTLMFSHDVFSLSSKKKLLEVHAVVSPRNDLASKNTHMYKDGYSKHVHILLLIGNS